MLLKRRKNLAYVVGLSIGDGNLSNPNGRATRLRITCDDRYPKLKIEIINAIKKAMPNNKVSTIKRKSNCCDISCYSNKWEKLLGWNAKNGSKYKQNIGIPKWIKNNIIYSTYCLKGLFQTDGSIYNDRGYKMVNFVTVIPTLAKDTVDIIKKIGFKPKIYKIKGVNLDRYNIRISSDVKKFITATSLSKK
jgi:DNA-binding transcriptional regulator WhiA